MRIILNIIKNPEKNQVKNKKSFDFLGKNFIIKKIYDFCMKIILQRVASASVEVNKNIVGKIEK